VHVQVIDCTGSPCSPFREGTAGAAFKRAIGRQADRARNGRRQLFSAAGGKLRPRSFALRIPRLCIAKQKSCRPPSSAALRPLSRALRGAGSDPPAVR
jgi:hypothetical protein